MNKVNVYLQIIRLVDGQPTARWWLGTKQLYHQLLDQGYQFHSTTTMQKLSPITAEAVSKLELPDTLKQFINDADYALWLVVETV